MASFVICHVQNTSQLSRTLSGVNLNWHTDTSPPKGNQPSFIHSSCKSENLKNSNDTSLSHVTVGGQGHLAIHIVRVIEPQPSALETRNVTNYSKRSNTPPSWLLWCSGVTDLPIDRKLTFGPITKYYIINIIIVRGEAFLKDDALKLFKLYNGQLYVK